MGLRTTAVRSVLLCALLAACSSGSGVQLPEEPPDFEAFAEDALGTPSTPAPTPTTPAQPTITTADIDVADDDAGVDYLVETSGPIGAIDVDDRYMTVQVGTESIVFDLADGEFQRVNLNEDSLPTDPAVCGAGISQDVDPDGAIYTAICETGTVLAATHGDDQQSRLVSFNEAKPIGVWAVADMVWVQVAGGAFAAIDPVTQTVLSTRFFRTEGRADVEVVDGDVFVVASDESRLIRLEVIPEGDDLRVVPEFIDLPAPAGRIDVVDGQLILYGATDAAVYRVDPAGAVSTLTHVTGGVDDVGDGEVLAISTGGVGLLDLLADEPRGPTWEREAVGIAVTPTRFFLITDDGVEAHALGPFLR